MKVAKKQEIVTIYFSDPDRLAEVTGKVRYGARVAVSFSAKDPLQMAAYKALRSQGGSQGVRGLLGIDTYKQLVDAAEAAGQKPSIFIRTQIMRLRFAASPTKKRAAIASVRRQLGADMPRVTPFSSIGVNIEDAPEPARRLLDRYAPDAKRILDPFAGTANVAIVAAERGLEGYWCEIDPVVRSIAQLKIDLLLRTRRARLEIAVAMRFHKKRLPGGTASHEPLAALPPLPRRPQLSDYARRVRTYIDLVSLDDPLIGRAMEAAVAEALARVYSGESALLTQTKDREFVDQFRAAIEQEIVSLIAFLHASPALSRIPQFLAADASTIGDIVPLGADVVITAPPPLTLQATTSSKPGRWFMGIPTERPTVEAKGHVASLRRLGSGAFTGKQAGISRTRIGFQYIETVRGLREVILRLDDEGHSDLARAVLRYFVQMGRAIAAVDHHLAAAATFILDISDYRDGDVRVDTDQLFGSLLRHYGFALEEDLPIGATGDDGAQTRRVMMFRRKGWPSPEAAHV